MNDFYELEKKCKKLQQKQLVKYILISLLFFIIVGLFAFIAFFEKKEDVSHKVIQPKPKVKVIIKEKNITKVVVKKVYIEKNVTKPKEIKAPVLNLDIDLNNIKNIKDTENNQKNKKVDKKIEKPVKKSIIQDETITFEKALTLAKNYYENGDYKNSIKWCKLASKIDNNDERVWKLYALNLEKTGQKQKAIKVLKTYLKYKDSLDLKYLLQRLEE